jgi:hypothetical protein
MMTVFPTDKVFSDTSAKATATTTSAIVYESLFLGNGEKERCDIRLAIPNNNTASTITLTLQARAAPAAPNLRTRITAQMM